MRGPNFMSKEIYFVRHGVPENDADSFRFSGFTRDMLGEEDHPLAERGRAQARAVAPGLRAVGVERLIASTMLRASETARIIAEAADIPLDEEHFFDDLIEIAPGRMELRMEGLMRWCVAPGRPAILRRAMGALLVPVLGLYFFVRWYAGKTTDGHGVAAVRERLDRVFDFIQRRPEGKVGVVCHSFLVLFLIRELRSGWWSTLRFFETPIENCSVTRIDLDAEGRRVAVFGARRL